MSTTTIMMRKTVKTGLLAVCLLAILQSCFTAALWGGEVRSMSRREDPRTGESSTRVSLQVKDGAEDSDWSFGAVVGRVFLTPLTLVLDAVTCPVQLFWYENGDDDPNRGWSECR